jgi:hypothetical protein
MTEVAKCPKCGASINDAHANSWCTKCGEPLPSEIKIKLPKLVAIHAAASRPAEPSEPSTHSGTIFGVIGVLLLVFGAMRWNSAGSQLQRALGGTDGFALLIFAAGAVALAMGFSIGFSLPSSNASSPSSVTYTAEERLRRLDDLRSKQLISDSDYDLRKKEIIASL